jgi:uncharacterized protein YvpB
VTWFTVCPVHADELPPSALVEGLVGHPQEHNLSCESRSATDLAAFWGVVFTEDDFLRRLSKSDNPNRGFLGDVDLPPGTMPPAGYGVYAGPVAANLRSFGLDAVARRDWSLEGLKAEVAAGRPVIIWATYDMRLPGVQAWTSADGAISTIVQWQHTFIVVGYEADEYVGGGEYAGGDEDVGAGEDAGGPGGLYMVDAYDAATRYFSYEAFTPAWEQLGRMAVTVQGVRNADGGLRNWSSAGGRLVVDGRWSVGPD